MKDAMKIVAKFLVPCTVIFGLAFIYSNTAIAAETGEVSLQECGLYVRVPWRDPPLAVFEGGMQKCDQQEIVTLMAKRDVPFGFDQELAKSTFRSRDELHHIEVYATVGHKYYTAATTVSGAKMESMRMIY
ncbi:hypothetical protein [Bifidobacterium vespertilionis]|uniref:Uncharacterized protein n=1 Tax=Bifidobacterium vespertilionis TaxID=2562524 RepID=A0A5J5E1D6_9BIFI|nr:hypothetical protein [Bifidobacterium vespertilionis]KAA8818850.1 hypothetical protein EMO90_09305 [Bifidobacterium vespertilionis]KAA8822984.1 hypothetical protein EM848_07365 [Bifidobacterium vespertilionis]